MGKSTFLIALECCNRNWQHNARRLVSICTSMELYNLITRKYARGFANLGVLMWRVRFGRVITLHAQKQLYVFSLWLQFWQRLRF